jgi:hypothetical protein
LFFNYKVIILNKNKNIIFNNNLIENENIIIFNNLTDLNTKLNTKLKSDFNIKLNNLKNYNNIFFKLNNKKSKVYIIKKKLFTYTLLLVNIKKN